MSSVLQNTARKNETATVMYKVLVQTHGKLIPVTLEVPR